MVEWMITLGNERVNAEWFKYCFANQIDTEPLSANSTRKQKEPVIYQKYRDCNTVWWKFALASREEVAPMSPSERNGAPG